MRTSLPTAHRLLRTSALALTAGTAACASGRAAPPALVAPDRPGYSYGTSTAPLGATQLEVGYSNTRAVGQAYHSLGEGLLRVGVGPRTELRVVANSYAIRATGGETARGLEDAKLGFKQRLVAGSGKSDLSGSSVSLLGGVSVPTGSVGFGTGAYQPEATLAAVVPLDAHASVTGNVGYAYAAAAEDRRDHRMLGTVAGWYALSSSLSVFGEYAGSQLGRDAGSRLHYLDAGVAVVPISNIQLDARVGHGVNGERDDYFFGFGLTRRW
jgi:hypothetical protein